MSHASGECRFKDGTVYYFEYNGTSDITLPELFKTTEDLRENWRKQDWSALHLRIKAAEADSEEVELYSSYGGGFTYAGTASKKELVILSDEVSEETVAGQFRL